MATRQWLDQIPSCPIRWNRLAGATRLRPRPIAALVLVIAAWQGLSASSGEPDRQGAVVAAHADPGHLPSRSRTDLTLHVDRVGFIWPVQGSVTSRFGPRGLWGWHRGVDIKAPHGAPIHAAAAGTVMFSGRQSSYGRVIKIAHANGLSTIYAHNSANFVKTGDRVRAGALIGSVGRTGHATAHHLHFEVRRQGVAKNPLPLLRRPEPSPTVATHQRARSDASATSQRRHDPIGPSKIRTEAEASRRPHSSTRTEGGFREKGKWQQPQLGRKEEDMRKMLAVRHVHHEALRSSP